MPPEITDRDFDPNYPGNWSHIVYDVSRMITEQEIAGLLAAMHKQYGSRSRVEVSFNARRKSLHFLCGEIKNLNAMGAFERLTEKLVRGLQGANPRRFR